MTTVMKGNDGKGARRRLHQKLTAIISFISTLFIMALFWEPDPEAGAAARHLSSSLRSRMDAIRGRVQEKAKFEHHGIRQLGQVENGSDLQKILEGKYSLVDVHVDRSAAVMEDGSYHSITGSFCQVEWGPHKSDPSSTPMFRDVVYGSHGCKEPVEVDLQTVMEAVSTYDQEHGVEDANGKVHLLELKGFVFHESRCGSTLVANVLQAMYPDENRVCSESAPPINTVRLADMLGPEAAVTVLKDVVYLMSRSNDPKEKRIFFKVQSIGSTYINIFLEAFPETAYMFVYRDPTQVMVSQFAHGVQNANCVRAQSRHPSHLVRALVQRRGIQVPAEQLDPEDLCAAHLAGITESALHALTEGPNPYGTAVNYNKLPQKLYEEIFPDDWELEISTDALERMQAVAGVYSKGRGPMTGQAFEGDSEEKEEEATDAVREAAEMFLSESYQALEQLSKA